MLNQLTIDGGTRKKDKRTGFFTADVLAAKVGVQDYYAAEIGVEPVDESGIVSVARLPEDVFAADSLDSWKGVDITNDHPTEGLVTVDNFKMETVGNVIGEAAVSNNHVRVKVVVKDAHTIESIENGKSEVSAGYTADYIREDGVFEGTKYNYRQRNIRLNHLAVVNKGRAKTAVILDSKDMYMEQQIKELQAKIEQLQAQNAELEKRPTYDAIPVLLKLTKDAQTINPDGDYNGKDAEAIKREALGDKVANRSVDVVDFVFEAALAEAATVAAEVENPVITVDASTVKKDYRQDYLNSLNIKR